MGGHFALTGSVAVRRIGWARPADSTGEAVSDTPADENARNEQPRRRQQPDRPARGGDSYRSPRNDGGQGGRPRSSGTSRDRSSSGGGASRDRSSSGGGASRDRSSSTGGGSFRTGRSDRSEGGYRRAEGAGN